MFLLKPYSVDKFIDREVEINLITGILRQLRESEGHIERTKAILFTGERGFGKTWLSLHLHRTVLREFNTVSLYLALFPLVEGYTNNLRDKEWVISGPLQPETTCHELMKWVCRELDIALPNDPTIVEMRKALVDGVEENFKQSRFLVFILDSVFEADWKLLETIERNLLAPLAELANVLFIMTGRGKPYPWISPALRLGMQEKRLAGIPFERLGEFKTVHAPASHMDNNKLAVLASGSPLIGYLLLQVDNPEQALNAIADYLLDVVPPKSDRRRLREAFEALCVLEKFREYEMEMMLRAYYEAKNEPMAHILVRDLRDELLKTYLFRWEDGGFKVDASLRNLLRNYLSTNQMNLWQLLNYTAYQMYMGFAHKYSQYKAEYENQANSHKEILEATDFVLLCQESYPKAINS